MTLIRFELAYYSLFKCNLRPLATYPAVLAYLVRLLQVPAFAASVRADHIKAGYYSIKALSRGLSAGPLLDYLPRDDAPRLLETHQVRHGALISSCRRRFCFAMAQILDRSRAVACRGVPWRADTVPGGSRALTMQSADRLRLTTGHHH